MTLLNNFSKNLLVFMILTFEFNNNENNDINSNVITIVIIQIKYIL
jgi:hypothetical protein